MLPPLSCPVRGCGLALERRERAWTCERTHSFDIARSGYVNLLQPQDRRSPRAGDSPAALDARQRLTASGDDAGLHSAVAALLSSLRPAAGVLLELGCGTGDLIGPLTGADECRIGIDLSAVAIERAARSWPDALWIVANADRRLPLLDDSVDLIVSVHARRNPEECARVLRPNGTLVVAVPAWDDLVELRKATLGQPNARNRGDGVVTEHAGRFELERRFEHRQRSQFDVAQLNDLLAGTYRGARHQVSAARDALEPMQVTLASEILLFKPAPGAASGGPSTLG